MLWLLVFLFGFYCLWTYLAPLRIVWDLDETLISSQELGRTGMPQKEQVQIVSQDSMQHIDDDGITFITYIRPHAKKLLRLLKFLNVKQYVFTSASRGYMNNVVHFLDPDSRIFEPERLCFSPGVNLSGGKDIRLLTPLITSRNAFLIDDNPRYLMANPPGLRIKHYKWNGTGQDKELFRIAMIILCCTFVPDVKLILRFL